MPSFSRTQFIRRAYQTAGLLEASQSQADNDYALASDLLAMELDALQAEHIVLGNRERTTKTLSSGTATYTLDDDCVDVVVAVDNIIGTVVPSSGAESHVRVATQDEYLKITNKAASGTPVLCMIERFASVQATFWPVPSATFTFKYVKQSLFDETALDMSRKWQLAVLHMLAHRLALAKSVPLDRVRYLREEAQRLKAIAMANDNAHVQAQLWIES